MAINNSKKDSGKSSSEVAINFCSINKGGISDRRRFTIDKYCHDKSIDILAIQESLTVDKTNLNVNSMDYITDTNNSLNRGASLYVNSQKFSINQLPQVSKVSRNLDTAWGLVCGKGFRYVVGSVKHKEAVIELIKILESAKKQASQLKAKGIIVFGDYNARNRLWGNQIDNQYGEELADKLDFIQAGIIWINNRSIQEVEKVWYKTLKSAIGAVFHIKQSLAEAIVGIPPISVANKVNSTKHLLKLNLLSQEDNPLKIFVTKHLSDYSHSSLSNKAKDAMQFLKWKREHCPDCFNVNDRSIFETGQLDQFAELSVKACSYTKGQKQKYTELLWQSSIDNQFQIEGFFGSPKVSTSKLKFPRSTTRDFETMFLSLFYPNNLMKEFLYRYDSRRYNSPSCPCGNGCQNSHHLLLNCEFIDEEKRSLADEFMGGKESHYNDTYAGNAFLISWSRNPKFFKICTEIMTEASTFLLTEIEL